MGGFETQIAKMQIQLEKAAALAMLYEAITFGIAMAVLYLVIKWAIRDGLKASGLIDEIRRAGRKNANEPEEPSFMREK